MMTVTLSYCFYFISTFLISYLVIFLLDRFATASLPKKGLSHSAIRNMVRELNIGNEEGMCFGFTLLWASENALGQEQVFYRRLELAKKHQSNLSPTVKAIKNKLLKKQVLTEDEQLIESIPRWLGIMHRAQSPEIYKNEYGQLVWQSDIKIILKQINNQAGLTHVVCQTHSLSESEAIRYFKMLKRNKIRNTVSILLSSMGHTVGLKRMGSKWRFIDINSLFSDDVTPYHVFNSRQLVVELYSAIDFLPNTDRLTFNIDLIAKGFHSSLQASMCFVFPMFSGKNYRKERVYFFAMAAMQGDVPTVRQCLSKGWSIVSRLGDSNRTPINTAILNGRLEVIKLMCMTQPNLINHRRKKDHMTMLHYACKEGGAEVVAELLKFPNIKIDPRDKSGQTPLFWACIPTWANYDRNLFKLLFDKGASLDYKDKDGLNAQQHANRNKHVIAQEMIASQLQDRAQSQSKFASCFFKKSATRGGNEPNHNEQDYNFYTL